MDPRCEDPRIRPFWYVNYTKEDARDVLEREFDWRYYGGHHLESRITAFTHSVYLPQKFGADLRNNSLAALVRLERLSRQQAWEEYSKPPYVEPHLVDYFRKRLGISEEQYRAIIERPARDWREFPTYKERFERLRPLIALLVKADLVPLSFYLKYCFPVPEPLT